MACPLRTEYEGAWYHVMNRGRSRENIFPDETAYQTFLETLAETVWRFRVEVHAYCLMPNHYHLLVRMPEANLARAVRQVDGLYTQRHNRHQAIDGPLFRGRYKTILVDADDYLLSVTRYLHRNPIHANSPLVEDLGHWPWSSYPAFIGRASAPDWLVTQTTYSLFGRGRQPTRYRRFVAAGVDYATAGFYERQRQPPVLGDESFREWALARADTSDEVPSHQHRPWRDPNELIAAVASHYGVSPEAITARGRKAPERAEPRQRAMWLCREKTGLTLPEIGQRFGDIHYSAINQNIRRLKTATDETNLNQWRRQILTGRDTDQPTRRFKPRHLTH